MKVTASQLKSLIKESIHEVLKEQVKGIDIEGHKNLTITSDNSFDDLPEWFQKAKTKDAKISLGKGIWYDQVTWHDGVWLNGTWIDGIWKSGVWMNGLWLKGTWQNGTWQSGVWNGGFWIGGEWISGIWVNGEWFDKKNPHPNER